MRGADGLLAFHHSGGDTFAIKEWLAADADARDYHDRKLGEGIACDPRAASASSPMALSSRTTSKPDAFEEDCRRAVLIVTTRDRAARLRGPGDRAFAVARARSAGTAPDRFGLCHRFARPPNFDRPWAPQRLRAADTASPTPAQLAAPRAPPRDATPRQDDIEADQ